VIGRNPGLVLSEFVRSMWTKRFTSTRHCVLNAGIRILYHFLN